MIQPESIYVSYVGYEVTMVAAAVHIVIAAFFHRR